VGCVFMVTEKGHPKFVRTNYRRSKRSRVKEGWRYPRGQDNKQKRNWKYMPAMPSKGYGRPAALRGLRGGLEEALAHNPAGLVVGKLARIASGVGKKKRLLILASAKKQGIKVVNPGAFSFHRKENPREEKR